MKIIKSGNLLIDNEYQIKCYTCQCVFTVTKSEMRDLDHPGLCGVNCPSCTSPVYIEFVNRF